MTYQFAVGDRFEWNRASEKNTGTILEMSADGKRAQIKVDGWMGTNWETLGYAFKPITKEKRK